MGAASTSTESTLFLTGAATYLSDLRDPLIEGAAHAVFVRSTVAHARFTVEVAGAEQAPGVLAVVTAADNPVHPVLAYTPTHPTRFAQPLLAEGKVRYVGEPIAAVIAETRAAAVDAAEHVVVEYDELRAVLSLADAATDEVLLFAEGEECRRHPASVPDDSAPTNVLRTEAVDGIDTPADDTKFDVSIPGNTVVSQRVLNPRQLAAPIECRGSVAVWTETGELHTWASTQTPHSLRGRLAALYDMEPRDVHVIAGPFVGGGFGGKGAPGPEEQFVPHLARVVGRPVRWQETRTENLTAAPHGRAEEITVTLAGTPDGDMTAIRVDQLKDAGAYPSSGAGLPNSWSWPMITGPYRIDHAEYRQRTVVTNRSPVAALRGAGRAPVIAAIERAVDLYADRIGVDPAEVRARNLIRPEDMPFTSPTTGFVFDEADYPEALRRVLELSDYQRLRADQAARRSQGGDLELGIGLACYNHRTCGGGGEAALVRINPTGSATVVTGTTSQGQDHESTWRTIASAELGIAPDQIEVIEGVTDLIGSGVGAVGSRSVQTAGLAIQHASGEVIAQASALAAAMLEAAEADIVFERSSGSFSVVGTPARSLGWVDIAAEIEARDEQLSCEHLYDNNGNDVFPSGTHLAVVEVDVATGFVELLRFVAVDDAGVRVNPASVEGQLHGGIALGIAQVLGEEASYDEYGNPLAASFLDYAILSIDQMCQLELEEQAIPTSFNPGGWKAVGESGPIGSTPAVHNAVLDAVRHLGVDHIDIPLTSQKLWNALRAFT